MPSDRLHPVSVLFAFARSVKYFALPGVILLVTGRSSRGLDDSPSNWELWMMLMLIPAGLSAITRYLSFRVEYAGTELIIRSGIFFRNERHVPYARIQNLDAVRNPAHRLFGVTDVRVETGAGNEPEATISVISLSAFDQMRQRVFAGRETALARADVDPMPGTISAAPRTPLTLLYLPIRELLLCGFLENKGLVLIGAAYGVAWEFGVFRDLLNGLVDVDSYGTVGKALGTLAQRDLPPPSQLLAALAAVFLLLLVVRLVSMVWALVRLYGFRLTRVGDDLRTEFGLLTRVTATIPQPRVQTMTILEGPLHRLVRRTSVRVETAGGGGAGHGRGTNEREWIAPIVRVEALPALVRQVLPDLDMTSLRWQPAHPRAFARAVKPRLLVALLASLPLALALGWFAAALLPLLVAGAVVSARMYVTHLGWISTDDLVAFRSGWLWRSVTVARVAKIQAVTTIESPFDRRAAMARVCVDTAGGSDRSHRVDIPYLPRQTAFELHSRLAALAASTTFRW